MSDNAAKTLATAAVLCTTIAACAYLDAVWPVLVLFVLWLFA